jgi:hypothetical protein
MSFAGAADDLIRLNLVARSHTTVAENASAMVNGNHRRRKISRRFVVIGVALIERARACKGKRI